MYFSDSYPPKYIYIRFMKFFTNYLAISTIIPVIETEYDFKFIRDYLLNKPTTTEHQIALRIAKAIDSNSKDTVDNPLVKAQIGKNSKWINNLIIHYTHENRLENYKKDIHQL